MRNTLFGATSEEQSGSTISLENLNAAAIVAMEAEAGLLEDMTVIGTLTNIHDSASVVADNLGQQIGLESKVATTNTISLETAQFATLATTQAEKFLGIPSQAVSLESTEANPSAVAKVSLEDKKELLKKVVDKLKDILRKIIISAKKMFVKFLAIANFTESSAKKFIEDLDITKLKDGAKIEDKDEKKFAKQLAGFMIVGGNDKIAIKSIVDTYSKYAFAGDVEKFERMGLFKNGDKILTELDDEVKIEKDDTFVLSSIRGTGVKGFITGKTMEGEGEAAKEVEFIKNVDSQIKESAVKARKVEILSIEDIKAYAQAAQDLAAKFKDYTKDGDKALGEAEKVLKDAESAAKDAEEGKKTEADAAVDYAKQYVRVIPSAIIDDILGLNSVSKTLLATAKSMSDYYTK